MSHVTGRPKLQTGAAVLRPRPSSPVVFSKLQAGRNVAQSETRNRLGVPLRFRKKEHPHIRKGSVQIREVHADGSDAWRLDEIANMIKEGAIGIIPTDSYPALVCDLEHADSVQMLAELKDVSPLKPMSILVRGFHDVDHYTLGWPTSSSPGMPSCFGIVKGLLPGAYTFILPASKMMPKVQVSSKHRRKQRHTVGVRMPNHPVTQHLLSRLDRPLLATSVHFAEDNGLEIPDGASMADLYPDVDFVIDTGGYGVAEPSTVVDMLGSTPEVLRVGKGDPAPFDPYEIL